jgi:hypothetical protein
MQRHRVAAAARRGSMVAAHRLVLRADRFRESQIYANGNARFRWHSLSQSHLSLADFVLPVRRCPFSRLTALCVAYRALGKITNWLGHQTALKSMPTKHE